MGIPTKGLSRFNQKLLAIFGGTLMAIGTAGMFVLEPTITHDSMYGYHDNANGFWLQMNDYVWMFIGIAGLFFVIYASVSVQREAAKKRGVATGASNAA
jgi:hypothetical protein